MLGDEYRVAAHRRLPAVVGDFRRRQPLTDKIFGMPADGVEPFLPDVGNVRRLQPEAAAERRTAQTGKISSVMMVHRFFFLYCKTEKNGGKGFFVRLRKSLTTDVSYGSLKPLKDYFYNRYENGRIEKTVETHDDCGN